MTWFPAINLVCTGLAAGLWYLFPGLGVWPLLIAVLPWLIRLERTGRWDWRTPYDWPILLFLLTAVVSLWSAFDMAAALLKFWMIISAIFLFYAFAAFNLPGAWAEGKNWAATPAWLLAIFGAIVTIYFLTTHNYDQFPAKYAPIDALGRAIQAPLPILPGHRLNPNVVGGMLAMMIPFGAAVTWVAAHRRSWQPLVLGSLLLGFTFFGLLMTTSRGAWLALLAAVGLTLLWWLTTLFSGQQPQRRRLLFLAGILIPGFLVIITLLLQPDLPQSILLNMPVLEGNSSRLDLLRNSLILILDYPVIGAGLGSFMMLYSTYAYMLHVGFIIHAHNLFFDVAIEQGLFALMALLWMWGIFGIVLWRKMDDGRIQPYLAAAALSLLTILLHGLVEDALYGSRALMLLFVPLAFTMPHPQVEMAVSLQSRAVLALAITGLVIVVLLLAYWKPIVSTAVSNLAAVRQSRAELSLYSWPEWPIQDAVRREIDLSPSIAGYERALELNPNNASANRRLGQIELSLGQYTAARGHLQAAYQSMPWDNGTRQLYGEALILNGDVKEGMQLWDGVNNAQEQLSARQYWYSSIGEGEQLKFTFD